MLLSSAGNMSLRSSVLLSSEVNMSYSRSPVLLSSAGNVS